MSINTVTYLLYWVTCFFLIKNVTVVLKKKKKKNSKDKNDHELLLPLKLISASQAKSDCRSHKSSYTRLILCIVALLSVSPKKIITKRTRLSVAARGSVAGKQWKKTDYISHKTTTSSIMFYLNMRKYTGILILLFILHRFIKTGMQLKILERN